MESVPRRTGIRSRIAAPGAQAGDVARATLGSVSGDIRRSRRQPGRPTPVGTSWDRVAGWYDGWVGGAGSVYHRTVAIPAVVELLDPQPGEHILDVGAGQGVLAEHVIRAGAAYTGVDGSPRLVDMARRRHGRTGRFVVGDARRLAATPGLGRDFDAAVFLLSLQDMDPLDEVFASVAEVLGPRSRIVALMTHPAFRQPRHAGWGYDPDRKLTYRRVDAYLTPMAVPMKAIGGRPPTRSFHRPISAYVNGLAAHGFATDAMRELADLDPARKPGRRTGRPGGGSGPDPDPDGVANPDIPLFLALRARRG